MSAPVISVERVSMAYQLYRKPSDMLREALFGGNRHDTFWALRDVSLEVREGQRIGIVGPNGAGKSTLLQIIAGNLTPTAGSVAVHGKISSLLSMTPAWDLDASGLDNIRFNLAVQGIPERRIPHLVDDIVEFTELGPFIFHPVKTYSTGMGARLAFAIATAVEPEILIIDEMLGTGDGYFAGKAYKRMLEFCDRGRALLFVSHSTAAVQQLCNKVVWMQNGTIRLHGEAEFVLKQYEMDFRQAEDEAMRAKHIASAGMRTARVSPDEIPDSDVVRFRIVAAQGTYFSATHFIRAIRVHGLEAEPLEVPLELSDMPEKGLALALDALGSEWGRLHERGGIMCRLLTRVTGRHPGGQFLIRLPMLHRRRHPEIRVEIEASATDTREKLALEILDMSQGCWRAFEPDDRSMLRGGWERSVFVGPVDVPEPETAQQVAAAIAEEGQSEVEIREVYVTADGQRTRILKEREQFEVCVRVLFRKSPKLADVGIKFSRNDGVYVFWQSSGMTGANLEAPSGEKVVSFRFAPNTLGAGEYYINAHVSDGWLYPENYPYERVYARVVNATAFRVVPEMIEVDFGVLNLRVPVDVVAATGQAEPRQSDTGCGDAARTGIAAE